MNQPDDGTEMIPIREGIRMVRVCDMPTMSADYIEIDPGSREFLVVHHECDEAWYVLDGELRAVFADGSRVVSTGEWVQVPRGMAHGSANESGDTVRLLVINAPPWRPEYDHETADGAAGAGAR